MMSTYAVEQTASGVVLWTGPAIDWFDALDEMARDAGYKGYDDIPDEAGGADTLAVSEVLA